MKRILVVDGGGIKGIIPSVVLSHIEKKAGKPCHKIFDLVVGTSTGSIIAGMLANKVPAKDLEHIYVERGRALFQRNGWFSRAFLGKYKYNRDLLLRMMDVYVRKRGDGKFMRDCATDFMSVAYNAVSGRTHFQMSWHPRHMFLETTEVISWSALSATHYFGPINCPDYPWILDYQVDHPVKTKGAIWYDGGQGRNNCALSEAVVTAVMRGWVENEEVHVLSLGCGSEKLNTDYEEASRKTGKIKGILDYVLAQARDEAVYDQLHRVEALEAKVPNLHVYRLDPVISAEQNKIDAFKYTDQFVLYGRSLKGKVPRIFMQ